MLMDEIAEKLRKHYDIECYIKDPNYMDINDVVICSKNQYIFEDDVLYIVRDLEFNKLISFDKFINIIYILNNPVDLEHSLFPNKNLILFKGGIDSKVIYKEISSLLEENRKVMFYTAKLFRLLFRCKGMQQIVDEGYKILNNPIVVKDIAFNVIEYSESPKLNDEVRAFLKNDYLDCYDKFYIARRNKRGFEQVHMSSEPAYIYQEEGYSSIVTNVFVDKKVVAYIMVVEYQKPFIEFDYTLIKILSNMISLGIKRNQFVLNVCKQPYELLIEDILEGNIKNPKLIRERIKIIGGTIKEYSDMYMMTIRQTDLGNTIIQYIKKYIEKFFNMGQSVVYDNNIVIVINNYKNDIDLKNNIRNLQSFLSSNKMYAGVSHCFYNLNDMGKYYKQSVEAIELGLRLNKEDIIFFYEDYAVFHMFDLCLKKETLMKLCHPTLLYLLEYDEKNKTFFTYDFYVYLKSGQTLIESAQVLNISRRTMAERIIKIKDITGINLEDQNQVFNILISFKILDFLKKQIYKKVSDRGVF